MRLVLYTVVLAMMHQNMEVNMAKGEFEVALIPLDFSIQNQEGMQFGRMKLEKTYHGDLKAQALGEMLSVRTPIQTSAGYVALERIEGELDGQKGSFALQHLATMQGQDRQMKLEVAPDSGTGELTGIRGEMTIIIKDGKHFYEFTYSLPKD